MKRFLFFLFSFLSLSLSAQVMRVEMTDGTSASFNINKVAVVDFLETGSTEEDTSQKEAVTGAVSEYGITYAEITGFANTGLSTIANSSSIEMGIEMASSSDFYYNTQRYSTNSLTGNKFTVLASSLSPNTDYYYRAYVKAHNIYYNGEIKSLHTKDFENIVTAVDFSNFDFYSDIDGAGYWDISYDYNRFNAKDLLNGEIYVGLIYGNSMDDLNQKTFEPIYKQSKYVKVSVGLQEGETIYYQAATFINGAYKTFGKICSYTAPDRFSNAKGDGSENDPFNVDGINKFTSKLAQGAYSGPVYFKGKVLSFRSGEEPGNGYGYSSFYISDGEESSNTFYCFRVMAPGNNNWYSPAQLRIGDEVLLCGSVLNDWGTYVTASRQCYVCTINGVDTSYDDALSMDAKGSGSSDDPFNVAGIIKYTKSLPVDTNSEEVFFSGVVESFKEGEEPGNLYGNATFYVTDDEGKYKFYCFRVLGKDGVKFTDGSDIPAVGDGVIIRGLVVNYKGNTPETVSGKAYIEAISNASAPNGDFENWNGSIPFHWTTKSTAGNASLKKSTDAHSGRYSVEVSGTASANKRLGREELYLEAGSYTMSFWVKAATSYGASVRPGFVPVTNEAVGSYVYGDYANDIDNSNWRQVTFTFELGSSGIYSLVIMNSKNPGANVLIDDFKLYHGETIIIQ